jgi:hypothetical protein
MNVIIETCKEIGIKADKITRPILDALEDGDEIVSIETIKDIGCDLYSITYKTKSGRHLKLLIRYTEVRTVMSRRKDHKRVQKVQCFYLD